MVCSFSYKKPSLFWVFQIFSITKWESDPNGVVNVVLAEVHGTDRLAGALVTFWFALLRTGALESGTDAICQGKEQETLFFIEITV